MPKAYEQLEKVRVKLEKHYRDMQDMEFTVEDGTLYMLQTRTGKRTPAATFKIAVDMANEKLITKEEAIDAHQAGRHRAAILSGDRSVKVEKEWLKRKIWRTASMRCRERRSARLCSPPRKRRAWAAKGEKVILVRRETSPEDVGGMAVAQGILTATGGKTSHAAVVARGWGKCCIVGAEKLDIDYEDARSMSDGKTARRCKKGIGSRSTERRHRLRGAIGAGDAGTPEGVLTRS